MHSGLAFFFLSSVPDIDVVAVPISGLVPDPHIGDVLVVRVPAQPAGDVPLQAGAVRPSPDGVVPAIYRAALQPQAKTLGIALRVDYPVADVEGGLLYDWLRGRRGRYRYGC